MPSGVTKEIAALSLEHVWLVLLSVAVSIAIAAPVAVLLTRRPTLRRWTMSIVNVLQTVPSLALFGFLLPLPFVGGVGKRTAIVALIVYALLPILRNTLTGILSVDRGVRESSVALGMTARQILWGVELPLAFPTILAGVRIATVTTIGTATIAAAIGGGGLGVFVFRGIAMADTATILAGAVPRANGYRCRRGPGMHRTASFVLAIIVTAGCSSSPRVVVGSKNFTEQVLLGEIIAQQIEQKTGIPVERKLNLGGTLLAHEALKQGGIDLYPEYTGTAMTAVLKQPADRDPATALIRVRDGYLPLGLAWLQPLGFDNTFAMVVRTGTAHSDKLRTLSDAARRAQPWRLGVGYEFVQRPDGLDGLVRNYGLRLDGDPVTMDLGLLYPALVSGRIGMAAASATDGRLVDAGFTVLADDRRYFPPYECAIVVRQAALERFPGLRPALDELSGRISDVEMRRMNAAVDRDHRSVADVAREFLSRGG